ncbi:response regulator [Candidatus Saccharibacteria bacterium]|nr:response regulator [Candidatus Saccharibacteria bacterium]
MTKVMVVEDDNSLREIYSIRLTAENYEVVSAGDGEEALAVAVREKPDLILSDVMMPKISGFDMLDILRQTPETANIKVVMMTALSSEDQRARGEGLGADRYLVKSQVGIEDVVNAIHDVLGDKAGAEPAEQAATTAMPETPAASAPEVASAVQAPVEVAPAPAEQSGATPVEQPVAAPVTPEAVAQPAPEVAPTAEIPAVPEVAQAPVEAPVAPAPAAPEVVSIPSAPEVAAPTEATPQPAPEELQDFNAKRVEEHTIPVPEEMSGLGTAQ